MVSVAYHLALQLYSFVMHDHVENKVIHGTATFKTIVIDLTRGTLQICDLVG